VFVERIMVSCVWNSKKSVGLQLGVPRTTTQNAFYKQLGLQAYYVRCTRELGGFYPSKIIEGVGSLCRVPQETKCHFLFMIVGLFVTAPESEIRTNTRRRQMRQFASQ
jgi:hypothetical protein